MDATRIFCPSHIATNASMAERYALDLERERRPDLARFLWLVAAESYEAIGRTAIASGIRQYADNVRDEREDGHSLERASEILGYPLA